MLLSCCFPVSFKASQHMVPNTHVWRTLPSAEPHKPTLNQKPTATALAADSTWLHAFARERCHALPPSLGAALGWRRSAPSMKLLTCWNVKFPHPCPKTHLASSPKNAYTCPNMSAVHTHSHNNGPIHCMPYRQPQGPSHTFTQ